MDSIVYINFALISYFFNLPYDNALRNNIIRYYIEIFFFCKKRIIYFCFALRITYNQ